MKKQNYSDIEIFPSDLQFTVFSPEEIKKVSTLKVITGLTFDPLGHAVPGGLYDISMGTYGRYAEQCATCNSIQACPGHIGHIELETLVYNPFLFKLVQKILGLFCLNCFKIQLKDHVCEIITLQLQLIDAGYIVEAQELEIFKAGTAYQQEEHLSNIKTERYEHPRIHLFKDLIIKQNGIQKESSQITKTSRAIRSAIAHSTLQKMINKICIHCQKNLRKVRLMNGQLVYYIHGNELKNSTPGPKTAGQNKPVLAEECRSFLRLIYSNYPSLMNLLFPLLEKYSRSKHIKSPVDCFFMEIVPVTPPKVRPPNILHDQIVEHSQTGIYRSIIENNAALRVILMHIKGQIDKLSEEARQLYASARGETSYEKMYTTWQLLQTSVNSLLDTGTNRGLSSSQGLKQILEKKEGLIRKHMMGKRVNYAARTVITPDPNINVEEVGIPDIFAQKLSYPVPVTPWNVTELRKMVMNGPEIHPGANYVQDENGYTMLIPADNPAKRESMAKLLFSYPEKGIKIVHRHVINGDILLLNRQPSLHKPSIMAHKARILPGEKTFRLHYSNCKAYNADFDGDEMNAHLPQSEVSRAEAYNLVNVANNYLVPKDGTPLGGLIQDHIIAGVKLSIRGRFFNCEDYHQLVFQALSHVKSNIKLLPPTILKPAMLWSGKQILSTIIINLIPNGYPLINLHSRAKISSKSWVTNEGIRYTTTNDELCESNVVIHKGMLLTGVLDKQQYGATTYGLIHCLYELYGGEVSTCVLTAFSKVFTVFLQREGFSLGVQDILVTAHANGARRKIIKEVRELGSSIVSAALELEGIPPFDVLVKKMEDAYLMDPKCRVLFDRKYKSVLDGYTNNINKTCLPKGLILKFPANNLQLMVLSGAKGSIVNTMQISCLLGQIELEGKRPPLMISGKSLPSFTSFEMSPKSGGFIDGRFMTGIQPQDFFFHCMAGREGLIDTAVKTSRSGYLQRCLIKHLEGLTVKYDLTVRDCDNSVVQYLYGEDGLDILKSKFFDEKFGLKFLAMNAKSILHLKNLNEIEDGKRLKALKHTKKIEKWLRTNKSQTETKRIIVSPFTFFSTELRNNSNNLGERNERTGRRFLDEEMLKKWELCSDAVKDKYKQLQVHCPDPTVAIYNQDCYYGSISERLNRHIKEYNKIENEDINQIMYIKNIGALAVPGEPVGLLAAQSIGEPSTQMTLNTFHFAGRGEMNVTLGIPRLREILMFASANINTPSMDIPIKPTQIVEGQKLRIKLNQVTLIDVLHFVNVKIKLLTKPERAYQYHLRFQLLPRKAYKQNFSVKPKYVIKYIGETFFKLLFRSIIRLSGKNGQVIDIAQEKKSVETNEHSNDDEETFESKLNMTGGGNAADSSDDDSEINIHENDTIQSKVGLRGKDENEYDDADGAPEIDDVEECAENVETNNIEEEDPSFNDTTIQNVLSNGKVMEYYYDKDNYEWCKLTFNLNIKYQKPDLTSIISALAKKCVIHQVPHIKRAITYKDDNGTDFIKTEGINIVEMFKYHKILDLNRLYSNDIHGIAKTYGIEAAARVIIKEISNVFGVYGITVDKRHLSLIADYMTFDGTFQPLSRRGMENSASPLQQMSFESCLQFLKNAAGGGRIDDLSSPSSRLIVGLPILNGTGAFELITKTC